MAKRIKKKNFLPFKEARKLVHRLKINSQAEWFNYCKGLTIRGARDQRLPTSPDQTYENKGWKNWGDWIGIYNPQGKKRGYLPYLQARRIIHSLGMKNRKDWKLFHQSLKQGNQYTGLIPLCPHSYYHHHGWKGWSAWLGVESTKRREYVSYEEARKFVRSLKLSNVASWRAYNKLKLPKGIPHSPDVVYIRRNEWKNWNDFLGTSNVSYRFARRNR
ncbi:MAG: hypothetical protein JW780_06075 [Clostridiales bacterium]|nr:hypothetical protein [Clostridiales bacterium]